jgi:hypothetical protein
MTSPLILSTYTGMHVAEIVEFRHATGIALVRLTPGGTPVRVLMSELAIGKAA